MVLFVQHLGSISCIVFTWRSDKNILIKSRQIYFYRTLLNIIWGKHNNAQSSQTFTFIILFKCTLFCASDIFEKLLPYRICTAFIVLLKTYFLEPLVGKLLHFCSHKFEEIRWLIILTCTSSNVKDIQQLIYADKYY